MKSSKIFKILFASLFILHEVVSYKILRSGRSIDGGFNFINNVASKEVGTNIVCQAYSDDGDCLGDIYIEYYGEKCILCPVKCTKGHKKDVKGNCRVIQHSKTTTTTAKPPQKCYLAIFFCG